MFILNSNITLSAYNKIGIGVSFIYPIDRSIVSDSSVQFIDDTSQFLNPMGVFEHRKMLHGRGGQPNTEENCYIKLSGMVWFAMGIGWSFEYMNYKSSRLQYSPIDFETGIHIKNPSTGASHCINGMTPQDLRWMLGAIISPDGSGSKQIQHLIYKAKEIFGNFVNSSLSQQDKWIAVTSVIEPSLIYPLVSTFYYEKDIHPLDSITSEMKCLSLGLNWHFPHAILHGPTQLGGIQIPSTSQKNSKDRLTYFLYNIRGNSTITTKLNIAIIYTQVEVEFFEQFFALSYFNTGHLVS